MSPQVTQTTNQTEYDPEHDKVYKPLPTLRKFHRCNDDIRCVVGPVGSSKTSAATWEVCYYLPRYLYKHYGITTTRFVVVRNTYTELVDTTQKTVLEWFPWGELKSQRNTYTLRYPPDKDIPEVLTVELLFRSCDRAEDVKKFKSLEVTGYWIDESIEVDQSIKKMLKTRIGRFPAARYWTNKDGRRFGIETTNPPDVEHPTYSEFNWDTPPPGPIPEGQPKENHTGFWQPPFENAANLRPGYYEDLVKDYADAPDWAEIYVMGKPGITIQGQLIYNNFKHSYHVAEKPLTWSGGTIFRGWDNSGNCPACVVTYIPTAQRIHVLREFYTDRQNIVDFTQRVVLECNKLWPGAKYIDYADPAGNQEYSTREGDFTSNAKLMREQCEVNVIPSEQNLTARINAVDSVLARIDGLLIDPSCTRLINGFLGGYCYKEIGTSGVYQDTPMKNRFSHVHDSLQYVITKLTRTTVNSELKGFTPTRTGRMKRGGRRRVKIA